MQVQLWIIILITNIIALDFLVSYYDNSNGSYVNYLLKIIIHIIIQRNLTVAMVAINHAVIYSRVSSRYIAFRI